MPLPCHSKASLRQKHPAWRGVNLGGWLLLEPGPAYPLFDAHPLPNGKKARCEWDLMKILRCENALESLKHHRDTYITRDDFEKIKGFGLNAVRLPIGYWIVLGTSSSEPYVGPALNYVDQAITWAEEFGLEVLLDLHGCPGGESGDAPCGRRQRGRDRWHWTSWNFGKSLRALKVLAERYRDRACVTGIEVCNEPSNTVPLEKLCQYYDRAVSTIRAVGMGADSAAVVLPVFQRPMDLFSEQWEKLTKGKHQNVCFDVHYYHCFGRDYHGKTLAEQLRIVQQNAAELRKYPCVVGEWSLALGPGASCSDTLSEKEIRGLFGRAQLEAYKAASHGHFFWNWVDAHGIEWDWQRSYEEGSLSGTAPTLPFWSGVGMDPLEEKLDPSPEERRIHFGDDIFLRTFQGYYVEVEAHRALARWCDKGTWQCLTLCPATDQPESNRPCQVRNGDVVRFRAHTKCFLGLRGKVERQRRLWAPKVPKTFLGKRATEFVIHVEGQKDAQHRSAVWLECRSSGHMLDADGEKLRARWDNKGAWQRFVLEKQAPKIASQEAKGEVKHPKASPKKVSKQNHRDSLISPPGSPIRKPLQGPPKVAKRRHLINHRDSICASPQSPRPSVQSRLTETPRITQKRRRDSMCSLPVTPKTPDTSVQLPSEETPWPCFRVMKKRRVLNHRDSLCSLADSQ